MPDEPPESEPPAPEEEPPFTCAECGLSLVPIANALFSVKRTCETCGRDTYRVDRDPKTSGIKINKGDQLTLSADFLNRMRRLVGGARFTKHGLNHFARGLFVPDKDVLREAASELVPLLKAWEDDADLFLAKSGVLAGLERTDPAHDAELLERVKADDAQGGPKIWALLSGSVAIPSVREAIDRGDATAAAGAAVFATATRAMLLYKVHLEEAVWRGHAVEGLRAALQEWENNRKNDSEEFWQQMLGRHAFVLSQTLGTPTFVLEGKAYVGGKAIDNMGGSVTDFLLRNQLTHRTTLVEIKVPTAALLTSTPYRNRIYAPSSEVVGAVSQVMGQAATLAENPTLRADSETPYDPARSECVVIVGSTEELSDKDRRRSFDLYRSELRTVRVITYDELFAQVATRLRLFGG
jgi:hypothetical protein